MTSAIKPAVKTMATAIAAALCAQLAYAATPTAVWDCAVSGQELNTAQGGLTISAGSGSTVVNGAIRIGNSTTGYSGASIVLPSDLSQASVLVKYSNFAGFTDHLMYNSNDFYAPVFMSVEDSDGNVLGIGATNNAANLSWNWRTANGYHNNVLTRHFAEGPALPTVSGYVLFSYDATRGMRICLGTGLASLATSEKADYHFSGRTLKNIGLGGEAGYSYADGWPNLVIEKVALFTGEYLSASDVANYKFPSQANIIDSDVTVSELNTKFGTDQEIYVYLADGVTVTGDTTFNATTVHFICDGSFNMTPPPSNEATFDFSGVTGRPVLIYSTLPSVSGSKFTSNVIPTFVTDSMQWRGVIYITSATVTDFTSNTYGNESSVVRLGNVSGWLRAPSNAAFINTVPVEIAGVLTINNGNSANDGNPNRCTVFKKLSGSGWISADANASKAVVVIQDASEFTGNIGLTGKLIVFGDAMPSYVDNNKFEGMTGSIWVMEGASVTAKPASGNWWATGGIKVAGELRASELDKFGGGTTITTSDTGVFTLTSTGNGVESETDTSYARITGTGALKYEGTGWRALSATDFPTNMTLINEQTGDILLSRGQTYTIGSLAGSKNFQGNYGSGDRYLRVLQAKDTEWSGKIVYDYYDRFKGIIVAPGVSTNGTLTLSGTEEYSRTLTVEAGAKVNLTGTWVGETTVNGTLSGMGTVNGALTLANGSTLVANTTDPLKVSSLTTTGTVTISLTDSDIGKDFIRSTGTIDTTGTTFAFTVNGVPTCLTMIKTDGSLKAMLPGLRIILR